ncbi:E3 ubiquitin-protein ligase BRE1 [Meyerozyma sp. JA9]|nr:E3 ubiquitin-protein ligase BRE1 [Meyerozyma sp. JA9]
MAEKRTGDDPAASPAQAKRLKPLDKLSEDGPLTQSDVVYFKKEAIWRQMRAYKTKCNTLMADMDRLQRQYHESETKVNILDAWFEQIINQFDFATEKSEDLNEALLIKSTNQKPDLLDDVLAKRREHLLRILSPALKNTASSPDHQDLVSKLESLNNDLTSARVENEVLTKSKLELSAKVDELEQNLLSIHKQKEREDSKTLNRVNGMSVAKKEEEEEVPETTQKTEEAHIDSEELEKLSSELQQVTSHNNSLEEQLKDVSSKYAALAQENAQLQLRLNNLGDRDLINSSSFQELSLHNKQLQEKIAGLQKVNDKTVARLNELEAIHEEASAFANKELTEENEALKSQLAKCENDLVRIRTTRDELLSKNSILKSEVNDKDTNEALKQMNSVLEQRVKKLESAHAEEAAELSNADKLAEFSKDELLKRIAVLTAELKEIEVVFQQTREISLKKLNSAVDQEGMLRKLSVEKTKADQKYFASMRVNDSLTAENKILKAQISKSQEVISKFGEMERSFANKFEILKKTNDDFKAIKETSIQETSKLQDLVKALNQKKSMVEKEIKNLKDIISKQAKDNAELVSELQTAKHNSAKLESKLKTTESLLQKYKTNNTSSILQEDERQLEALRSIAKCSLCSKNWKDTAITVCGHVFCHSCTQERLAARLRRCPSCNKGFSANDLLSVHL